MIIYIYIKQHNITKLKYFGKTTKPDPYKYLGSGKRWLQHINKHGKEHVITCQVWEFESQEKCTKFALEFSKSNNIVESTDWANLVEENGSTGNSKGCRFSEEHKINLSSAHKNKIFSEEHKMKMSIAHRGKKQSEENKRKRSESLKGKPWSKDRRDAHSKNLI